MYTYIYIYKIVLLLLVVSPEWPVILTTVFNVSIE